MENMFPWLLVFAGAAIVLLGVFWIASERELKNKRQEIQRLMNQMGDGPIESVPTAPIRTMVIDDSPETLDLRAVNEELQTQVATLTAKLELGHKAIMELEGAAQRDQDSQAELEQLRTSRDNWLSETAELKAQLQASEARAHEAAAHQADAADGERALQNEIAQLQDRLEESQRALRELEHSQQNLANAESLAAAHADEMRQLEARIAGLEHELTEAREQIGTADSLRAKLAEAEQRNQALREASHRHEEEIRRWQERNAEGEENRQRLSALRAPFDALLAKHAELAAQHSQFEEDLASFGGLMAMRTSVSDPVTAASNHAAIASHLAPQTPVLDATMLTASPAVIDEADDAETLAASSHVEPLADPHSSKKVSRYGLISLVLIVPVAVALAYGVWNSSPEENARITTTKPAALMPATPKEEPVKSTAVAKPRVDTEGTRVASIPKDLAAPKKENTTAVKAPPTKAEQSIAGTYEITQAIRVYAAPTEFSQPVGDIEPGVKVNVVNARDGWLEIHSKRGRPPGFIRKEAARVVRN